jgi:hypothetical protein
MADQPTLKELMEADAKGEVSDEDFDTWLWLILCERIASVQDLAKWPEPVQTYFASRNLQWEVGNGGFAQAAMNIPEWFQEAAKGYERLGKPRCAALIQDAMRILESERSRLTAAGATLEKAFEYFDDSPFDSIDDRLDEVGWWSDKDRIDYVRNHRAAFDA